MKMTPSNVPAIEQMRQMFLLCRDLQLCIYPISRSVMKTGNQVSMVGMIGVQLYGAVKIMNCSKIGFELFPSSYHNVQDT